jgi:hypothetical protein
MQRIERMKGRINRVRIATVRGCDPGDCLVRQDAPVRDGHRSQRRIEIPFLLHQQEETEDGLDHRPRLALSSVQSAASDPTVVLGARRALLGTSSPPGSTAAQALSMRLTAQP